MANEVNPLKSGEITTGLSTDNLIGYQLGLYYQLVPKKAGPGFDTGIFISQKGYTYTPNSENTSAVGYKELNYVEVPLNLRYQIPLGFLSIFGFGGLYAGYVMTGKNVVEAESINENIEFANSGDRLDYGYNLGAGMGFFKKVQFSVNWSRGIKNLSTNSDSTIHNKAFTVALTYLF